MDNKKTRRKYQENSDPRFKFIFEFVFAFFLFGFFFSARSSQGNCSNACSEIQKPVIHSHLITKSDGVLVTLKFTNLKVKKFHINNKNYEYILMRIQSFQIETSIHKRFILLASSNSFCLLDDVSFSKCKNSFRENNLSLYD